MHTHRQQYSSTTSTPCAVITQVQHEVTHQVCTVHRGSRVHAWEIGTKGTDCKGAFFGQRGAVPHHPFGRGEGVTPSLQHVTGQHPLYSCEGQVQHPHAHWRVLPPICIITADLLSVKLSYNEVALSMMLKTEARLLSATWAITLPPICS